MQKEIETWETVFGFEDYKVSSFGNIENIKTGKRLKQIFSGYNKNYLSVTLWKEKKNKGPKYVHRIVLQSFTKINPKDKQCAHLDGNSKNNNLKNLSWVTPKENSHHKKNHGTYLIGNNHKGTKIKDEDCYDLIKLFLSGMTAKELSEKYKITAFRVNHILSGRRKNINLSNSLKNKINIKKKEIKIKIALRNTPWK